MRARAERTSPFAPPSSSPSVHERIAQAAASAERARSDVYAYEAAAQRARRIEAEALLIAQRLRDSPEARAERDAERRRDLRSPAPFEFTEATDNERRSVGLRCPHCGGVLT